MSVPHRRIDQPPPFARRAAFAAAVAVAVAASPLAPAACKPSRRRVSLTAPQGAAAPILLFDGTGTSPSDVAAVQAVLDASALAYAIIDTADLGRSGRTSCARGAC